MVTRRWDEDSFFGHPRGLTVLALTNMWEAFALFGMRTVLVYYLVKQLGFSNADAIRAYSYSVGSAFFLGIFGGVIADRILKAAPAITIGIFLMAAGSFALIVPELLYIGLIASSIGYGLFRPTVSAEVGNLYRRDDPRLERGYTILLVVSNFGGAMAPIVCGALGENYGWNWAFIASGIGMTVALFIFWFGRHTLRPSSGRQEPPAAGGAAPLRLPVMLLVVAWIAAAFVWAGYNQIGGAVALWADTGVDRQFSFSGENFTIPAAWFQSLNPILIIVLAPVVTATLARARMRPGAGADLIRIATGALLIALFFAMLAAAASFAGPGGKAPWLWLALAVVPYTFGELLFSPAGQALFSRAAPLQSSSFVMSIWFLTIMAGFVAAGQFGQLWDTLSPAVFFILSAVLPLTAALLCIVARAVFGKTPEAA